MFRAKSVFLPLKARTYFLDSQGHELISLKKYISRISNRPSLIEELLMRVKGDFTDAMFNSYLSWFLSHHVRLFSKHDRESPDIFTSHLSNFILAVTTNAVVMELFHHLELIKDMYGLE